ncbi:MAG: aldehyde dehydrogenase family protein [Phycisphaerales bacterium]|nr:aldehyde dehydrogenase family protein [Phycisphaerales bacterium]
MIEAVNLIGPRRLPIPGDALRSHNPAHPDRTVWSGAPSAAHVDQALAAARAALPVWSAWPVERRAEALRAFQRLAQRHADELAGLICDETGKPLWDSAAEAKLLSDKVDITLAEGPHSGRSRVEGFDVAITPTRRGLARFRPHGVMAVLGPFNFPAHLPNGHIVPALLAGNTVVFKPSDKTPAVGQRLAELFTDALNEAGAPPGVVNLVHGGADVAAALSNHDGPDGILFTGSWPVGRRIMQANLDRPGRILALEMGGNNPAIVMPDADLKQAVLECVRSAFVSSGQRCTCTRRVIVHRHVADRFLALLVRAAERLTVGDPRAATPQSFMGPLIRADARDAVLATHDAIVKSGGHSLLAPRTPSPTQGAYLTPAVVRVPRFVRTIDPARDPGCDVEMFGPVLRVSLTESFDDALQQADATDFGLASAIFTRDAGLIDRFLRLSRAGCVNVNTGTAGASSKLPFGGLGRSGNHRPAGAFSIDYCAVPVASLVEEGPAAQMLPGMTWDDAW